MAETPEGSVAIITGPDGTVWASYADFSDGEHAMRAKREVMREFIHKTCNPLVANAMDYEDCRRVIGALCTRQGFRIEVILIGQKGTQADG